MSKQRMNIIFMHITGFLILSYKPNTFSFDFEKLLVATGGLVFLIFGFYTTKRIFKDSCETLWNGMFFLLDVSLIMLQRLDGNLAKKQLLWMFFALMVTYLIPLVIKIIPKFEKLELTYLMLSIALLASTFLFGSEKYGATNWIYIGEFGFQPSEVVKFFFVFFLASMFRKEFTLKRLIITGGFSALLILMLVLQKDLGGALIFFMTFMIMLYIASGSEILFFLGITAFSGASVLAYKYFSHVRVRVSTFLNPWNDFYNTGNQIIHSLFAIGTWGLLGSGLTLGMPYKIPVVANDFIFAAICEELGGIFGICLLAIYVVIYYRGVHISLRTENKYYSLLVAGFTAMLAFQSFLIVGGVIKFIPLTGVTLPFVSYGGSSIVVCTLMVGIIQWVYSNHKNVTI